MSRARICLLLLLPLVITWVPAGALAWGQNGHRIVAEIGQLHLTPAVSARASAILAGRSLAQVSTWPDEIRSDPSWDCANPFHFVTVPPGTSYPGAGIGEGDAVQALVYYTDVLADPNSDSPSRAIALKFIVHIVGDLHQPLHAGLGCDRGGNLVGVSWFGDATNLHTVWDEKLIESEGLSFSEFVRFLELEPVPAAFDGSSPLDWIRTSQERLLDAYRCDVGRSGDRCDCFCGTCRDGLSSFGGCGIFDCEPADEAVSPRLAYSYRERNMPVAREQLRSGGLHLAELLNWALDPDSKPPESYRKMSEQIRSLKDWNKGPRGCRGD